MTDDLFNGLGDFEICPDVARRWRVHQRAARHNFLWRRLEQMLAARFHAITEAMP